MHRPKKIRNLIALALCVFSCAVLAEHEAQPPGWIEVGTTLFASATNADEPESADVVAFDVMAIMPAHNGRFALLIEAETGPAFMTDVPVFHAANNDARASFSASQNQVQLTEFHYDFATRNGEWAIGFIDSKAYIDTSYVANDDKTQFSNPVFVNNPTIGLPESSLGFSWQRPAHAERPGYSFVLATGKDSSTFVALETWWVFEAVTARLGAWDTNSSLSMPVNQWTNDHDYGFYTAIDGSLSSLNWNVRAGIANPGRNESESFISVAAEIPMAGSALGIAAGRSMRGDHLSIGNPGEARHAEIYYRYVVSDGFVITPCIQFLDHSELGDAIGALTAGVRLRLNI